MSQVVAYLQKKKVNIIKQRDILKQKLCQEHGIPLYYIKYNENVKERTNKILTELKQDKNCI